MDLHNPGNCSRASYRTEVIPMTMASLCKQFTCSFACDCVCVQFWLKWEKIFFLDYFFLASITNTSISETNDANDSEAKLRCWLVCGDAYLHILLLQHNFIDLKQFSSEFIHFDGIGQCFTEEFGVMSHPMHQLVQNRLQTNGLFEFPSREWCWC